MYGRVEWYDANGTSRGVDTHSKKEQAAICRELRRRRSTIRKVSRISNSG